MSPENIGKRGRLAFLISSSRQRDITLTLGSLRKTVRIDATGRPIPVDLEFSTPFGGDMSKTVFFLNDVRLSLAR